MAYSWAQDKHGHGRGGLEDHDPREHTLFTERGEECGAQMQGFLKHPDVPQSLRRRAVVIMRRLLPIPRCCVSASFIGNPEKTLSRI